MRVSFTIHLSGTEFPPNLKADPTTGDEIGSSLIDDSFADLVMARLNVIGSQLMHYPLDKMSWKMTTGHFQSLKREFSTENNNYSDRRSIAVPGLPRDFNSEAACIKGGRMYFTRYGRKLL